MKKIAVVYKSKYNSTEKYAYWIAEAVQADVFRAGSVAIDTLLGYDTIVYCGGVYAGGILGFSLIRKNYDQLKHKKLIVVAVGSTLKSETAVKKLKDRNFMSGMHLTIPLFLLRGGLNYQKMNLVDKTLMYLMVQYLKFKKMDEYDEDAKGLIATFGKVVDFTNKKDIVPVVNAIAEPKKLT